ncbi:Integrase core domain-containing protein, partial [Prauserella aidingensis]|nr:Integrase core domain-containing protein [Prauserella aidingensis]
SRQTYGCRRVTAALNRDGIEASVGLVVDLMREQGLAAVQPRAYKTTTVPGQQPVSSPDLLVRDFTAAQPGTRLVGDITYLRTGEGWLYLATVLDLATRMVVGWAMASHMRTSRGRGSAPAHRCPVDATRSGTPRRTTIFRRAGLSAMKTPQG